MSSIRSSSTLTRAGVRVGIRGALSAMALVIVAVACGTSNGNVSDEDDTVSITCTPGANVFCRCKDRTDGTKPCKADGRSFGPCTTGIDGECSGGEIEDPDTGKPVDDAGTVIEEDASTDPPIEACPGKITGVADGVEVVLTGDTTGARDDAKGANSCSAGEQAADHVYHLKPTGSGSLSVKVQGEAPLNPTIYMRSTCSDEVSQVRCGETTGAGGLEQFTYNVVAGRDYYLFVDGFSGSEGKYTATLKLTTGPFCGDEKVTTNEACDDGNKVDGDGCSNDCLSPSGNPASGNGCPGQPVDVWPGKTISATGANNVSYGNTWTKTGTSCLVSTNDLNGSPEHVYKVTAHGAGTLKVNLTPDPTVNLMLVSRATCTDPNSQGTSSGSVRRCSNDGSAGGAENLAFPVTNGQTVYVAVDGAGAAGEGNYSITFAIQ